MGPRCRAPGHNKKRQGNDPRKLKKIERRHKRKLKGKEQVRRVASFATTHHQPDVHMQHAVNARGCMSPATNRGAERGGGGGGSLPCLGNHARGIKHSSFKWLLPCVVLHQTASLPLLEPSYVFISIRFQIATQHAPFSLPELYGVFATLNTPISHASRVCRNMMTP